MVIVDCNVVVIGMVVVVVVRYCSAKGCHGGKLNLLGCRDDCDDAMVWVVLVG